MRIPARFLAAVVFLASTALFLEGHSHEEIIPPRLPLASFPEQLSNWTGTDIEMTRDVLDILGPGHFLLRSYRSDNDRVPSNGLFIAYFPSQRTGDTIHSPKNCLPGAGWTPIESSRVPVSFGGQAPIVVNRYVIAKGGDRQLVLYWYWAHNRAVASEYWAKIYLVTDSIRMHRSDGSLIRLTTLMLPGEPVSSAMQRLVSFGGQVVPLLNEYIPQ
jgi:EpsI family protein